MTLLKSNEGAVTRLSRHQPWGAGRKKDWRLPQSLGDQHRVVPDKKCHSVNKVGPGEAWGLCTVLSWRTQHSTWGLAWPWGVFGLKAEHGGLFVAESSRGNRDIDRALIFERQLLTSFYVILTIIALHRSVSLVLFHRWIDYPKYSKLSFHVTWMCHVHVDAAQELKAV